MRVKVKGLRAKETAGGLRYYWEPNGPERAANWKAIPLGADMAEAVKAAEKRNAEVEEWRAGGAKPKAVARHIRQGTVGHGLKRYRAEKLAGQSKNTVRTAETALRRLEAWAGDMPVAWVTRARVRVLRDANLKPPEQGGLGHHPTFHLLERGRIVWQWFLDEGLASGDNPFLRFGLGKPPPRQAYWTERETEPVVCAADAEGWPSVGLAVEIGYYAGQREADNLAMPLTSWREIPRSKFRADPAIYDTLAADAHDGPDAGKVMGLYVRQGKTKRWVGIPVEGDTRRRIEAAIEEARKVGRSTILGNEAKGGAPWVQDDFIKAFAVVRQRAADDARTAGDAVLADDIEALWYGDLRRSCVVYLGELGLDDAAIAAITGHSLATVKAILETYMPRTEGMAARAIMARREARGEVVPLRPEREKEESA